MLRKYMFIIQQSNRAYACMIVELKVRIFMLLHTVNMLQIVVNILLYFLEELTS
jgi:hypothetical protein